MNRSARLPIATGGRKRRERGEKEERRRRERGEKGERKDRSVRRQGLRRVSEMKRGERGCRRETEGRQRVAR